MKSIKYLHSRSKEQKKLLFFYFIFFGGLGFAYLLFTCSFLLQDKLKENDYWHETISHNPCAKELASLNQQATVVTTGTYINNIRELSVKNSNFRVVFTVWFSWTSSNNLDLANHFNIYNGTINKTTLLENQTIKNNHYQKILVDATISKNFWIVRFPLESYQLHLYLSSDYPVNQVQFALDEKNSTYNPSMTRSGFSPTRHAISLYSMKKSTTYSDPDCAPAITQEVCTSLELNRNNAGLYIKCFIALFGTLSWIFISLFICAHHKVDPFTMIPTTLFGTVTNVMVGANALPDALQIGLLEFVNIGGILVVLSGALIIMQINRIRAHDEEHFATFFGHSMLLVLLTLTILGMILYPLCSYLL